MNLGALRTEIRQELQEASAGEWTNAELDAYVNDGVLLTTQLLEWYEKTTNLVPGAGTQDYTLPTDNLRLHRVTFDREFLPQTTQYELDRDEGNWRGAGNNNPIRFFVKQWDTLSAYPKPLTAGTSVSFAQETATASGPNNPSISAVVDDGGSTWIVTDGVFADGGDEAQSTPTAGGTSDSLWATGFSFAINTNRPIVGIVVEVQKRKSGTNQIRDLTVQLVREGTAVGDNKADTTTNWTASLDVYTSYGSSSDLWGTTWTPAQVNASTFGVRVACQNPSGGLTVARIDHIRITVYFGGDGAGELGEVIGVDSALYTPDTDITFDSELGVVIAMEDSEGGHVRFEPDYAADAFSLGSSELGCVIDYDTDEGNFGLYYAALPDTLVADTDVPQIHQAVHPALIPYAVFRALEREGPMQDLRLAQGYFNDMADWMQAIFTLKNRQWPERSLSLEPEAMDSNFVRRLNEVGTGSLPRQQLRAHYE